MKLFQTKIPETYLSVIKGQRYPTNTETIEFVVNSVLPLTGESYFYDALKNDAFLSKDKKIEPFGKAVYATMVLGKLYVYGFMLHELLK